MESFIIYLGKAAIAAALFYTVYLILFQNHKQFTFNRIYLPVSLVLSFVIPLITFTTIKYVEPVSTININSSAFVTNGTGFVEIGESAFLWYHYLLGLYILGVVFFILHFLFGYFKALSIVRRGETHRFFDTDVCVTKADVHPFSFFNKIVISKNTLNHPNLKMIVNHENIHVKEKHTIDIIFTEFMFIAQWFNPFAWLIKDAVKNNLEYITDNRIVQNHNPKNYQLAMLTLADKDGVAPFLTALNGSQLKNRIIMMKKKNENKYAFVKQLLVLPLLAILIMGLSNKVVKTEVKESIPTSVASSDTTQVKAKKSNEEVQHVAYPTQRKVVVGYPIEKDVNNTEKVEVIAYGSKRSNSADTIINIKPGIRLLANQENENPPLYIVDGKIVDEINDIDEDDIESISILKGVSGTELYGEKGRNGVVLIELKEPSNVKSPDGVKVTAIGIKSSATGDTVKSSGTAVRVYATSGNGNPPLYIVDGKIVDEINRITPADIQSINVLKGEIATNKYGDKGKNGVIEIALKDSYWKEPVYFLDGKEVDKAEAYIYVGRTIVKETVRLKKEDAIAKYGKKGENGVVEIYTKESLSAVEEKK